MKERDALFVALADQLDTLIVDQERLLEVIRDKKTELVRVDRSIPATPSISPMHT